MSTTLVPSAAATLALLAALATPTLLPAQPLSPASCPAGSPFTYAIPNMRPPIAGDIPMLRHTIDQAIYPDARCNDDSPAVLYVRPANAGVAGNPIVDATTKWLIFFDGGGGCQNADDCLWTRWCSGSGRVAPGILDRAGKMSSLGAIPAMRSPGGLLKVPAPAGQEHFEQYNQVWVHYCSSDNGTGSDDQLAVAPTNQPAGGLVTYDIAFQGEAIVNAAIDTLIQGTATPDPGIGYYYETRLPDLHDATEILIGGESAGGVLVRNHLDRLRDRLTTEVPGVDVRAVVDAVFTPDKTDAAITWPATTPPDYADYLRNIAEPPLRTFWGADDSALDQSCLDPAWTADHNLVGSHPQVCYDTTYTQLNHLTTPVFVRMDLDDPMGQQQYTFFGLYPAKDDYWAAQYAQLQLLATYGPGFGGLEAPDEAPGVQGPKCHRHVAIQTNDGFYQHAVSNPSIAGLPFYELLVNWLTNPAGSTTVQIQDDLAGAGSYTPSFCP
jgi:Pectinacetylesterase